MLPHPPPPSYTRPPRQNLHDPPFCTFRGSCFFYPPVS
ncbi:hypothetical protein CGRA01v4_14822 [Colletotrichum graminicola]|nr:hypothetical protein CGRA01v4_14822 [Colletotrichum graminicola]